MLPSHLQFGNLLLIDEFYKQYRLEASSVPSSWRYFFEGADFGRSQAAVAGGCAALLIQAYRTYGYLEASFNPMVQINKAARPLSLEFLGLSKEKLDQKMPSFGLSEEPELTLAALIDRLREIYCGKIGYEYMGFGNQELEEWIQKRIEGRQSTRLSSDEHQMVLEALERAETLETFLHTKYPGQTRFSLEGLDALIPMLIEIFELGASLGLEEWILGMAHRGRLNVLVNVLDKPCIELFRECSDTALLLEGESGDVKYHKGFVGQRLNREQKPLRVQMLVNPSHLESVDPVVLGWVKAQQVATNDTQGNRASGLLIHGDASLAGQGVVYETLQFMRLAGYSTGGTIHIVTNNQIGFTASAQEGRSTPYCTDIAKGFGAPVFHVNAEDPEGCVFAARLAVEIRQKFHCDIFIDLNGYRKFGHNEGDEPSFTQPAMARWIAGRKSARSLYADVPLTGIFRQQLEKAFEESKQSAPALKVAARAAPFTPVPTAVATDELQKILERCSAIPPGFAIHPKLRKLLETRKGSRIDWAIGELLALGSLLWEGIPVRLSGQDSRRGTFSHRHAAWVDQTTDQPYFPLAHLKEGQGRFDIYNSPLSEFGAIAFEYGYSCAAPDVLVLWEAQYGDFSNGAQIVFDQYLSSGEQKWGRAVSLVLLLPHGHEGAGPEHTSARPERFLQMCAEENMCVAYPSTPAQYFHLLRRQALSKVKKPLIVMTPKGLLRSPLCVSKPEELSSGTFQEILEEPVAPKAPKRLFLCSGKIYYDIIEKRKDTDLFLRIEQLYPFRSELCKKIIAKYPSLSQFFWIQEEPENMGGWEYIRPQLDSIGVRATYIGRPRSASPATGSSRKHKQELDAIIKAAFG